MPQPDFDDGFPNAEQITVGRLDLPTGRIVACDPFFCADAQCFSRSVAPGTYDVNVVRVASPEWGVRIALAQLQIMPGVVAARYETATRGIGDSGLFYIHSGIASYMDEETRVEFGDVLKRYYETHPGGNYYTDILEAEFKRSAIDRDDPFDVGQWNLHRPGGSTQRVAMFSSGLGDGGYTSSWGLSGSGEVVSLVTEFGLR